MQPFKLFLTLLLFLVVPFTVSCAQQPPVALPIAQQAAHHIVFMGEDEWRGCSSTAVGSHTLVSAAHCVLGSGHIVVDGTLRVIVSIGFDEWDHFLVTVDGPAFPYYLPLEVREPHTHEHIQIWGWPGESPIAVHRDGTLLAVTALDDDEAWQWSLPVYHGDSGAGVISDDNTVLSVVSRGDLSARSISYPFHFSTAQLLSIQ